MRALAALAMLAVLIPAAAALKNVDLTVFGTYDADTEQASVELTGPGTYSLDLTAINNLPVQGASKKLDLFFILDSSGSMTEELDSVKESINSIIDRVNEKAPGFLNVGIYIFESKGSSTTGFQKKTAYCGGSDDLGLIPLTNNGLILQARIGQAHANGWNEPWAMLTKQILEDNTIGWRPLSEAVRMVIVITDEPADACNFEAQCHECGNAISVLNSQNAWFFALYNGLAKKDVETIGDATKGRISKYDHPNKIPNLILQAINDVISADDLEMKRIGPEWDNLNSIVSNFTIPNVAREGGTWTATIGLTAPPYSSGPRVVPIDYFAKIKTTNDRDDAWVKIVYNQPPVPVLEIFPRSGVVPLLVRMDASKSSDTDFDPLTFMWDIDGQTVTGFSKIEKQYKTPGQKKIRLTVSDGQDNATIEQTLNLTNPDSITDFILGLDQKTAELSAKVLCTSVQQVKIELKDADGNPVQLGGKSSWLGQCNSPFVELGNIVNEGAYYLTATLQMPPGSECGRCQMRRVLNAFRAPENRVPDSNPAIAALVAMAVLALISRK